MWPHLLFPFINISQILIKKIKLEWVAQVEPLAYFKAIELIYLIDNTSENKKTGGKKSFFSHSGFVLKPAAPANQFLYDLKRLATLFDD